MEVFAMLLNGKAYVPPTCPQSWNEGADVTTAPFTLFCGEGRAHPVSSEPAVEVFGVFDQHDPTEGRSDTVEVESFLEPANSEVAEKSRWLAGEDPTAVAARKIIAAQLCVRVEQCQRVTMDEEGYPQCWALGGRALHNIIEQLDGPPA